MDELGLNTEKLLAYASSPSYRVFVDLGVRKGESSSILLKAASPSSGLVYGIDNQLCSVNTDLCAHPNYKLLIGDSVTLGKYWSFEKPHFVFVDTLHVKEQVLCELYYWYDLLEVGGIIGFHDTEWDAIGKKDFYADRYWDTVASGLKEFFKVSALSGENENIRITHYPEKLGMTFVLKKTAFDFKEQINWESVFAVRKEILFSILEKISHNHLEF